MLGESTLSTWDNLMLNVRLLFFLKFFDDYGFNLFQISLSHIATAFDRLCLLVYELQLVKNRYKIKKKTNHSPLLQLPETIKIM
jgi:hypothetical protein